MSGAAPSLPVPNGCGQSRCGDASCGAAEAFRLLVGYCGLYCGACYHYRSGLAEGAHLLAEAARAGRLVDGYECRGCRSTHLYRVAGCAKCQIRACAQDQGLAHCGECPQAPCDRLRAFQGDGRPHHRDVVAQLRAMSREGIDAWAIGQARRWSCACGVRFSWYETRCARCGADLPSYGLDPRLAPRVSAH